MFKCSIIFLAVSVSVNSYAQNLTDVSNQIPIQKLDDVVVNAYASDFSMNNNFSANTISRQKIREQSGIGLGQILQNTVGVSSTGFGAVANRPSIRGLEGDHIKIMQNGNTLFDASSISYDHAVPVNPAAIDKIEIVKGTDALVYGGNASSGAINIVENRISKKSIQGIQGNLNTNFGGANNERSAALKLEAGLNENIVIHADVFSTKTSDIKISDFARSEALRNIEPIPINEEIKDKLPNTDSQSNGGAIGVSYINDNGFSGISLDNYNQEYGSPIEKNVRIKMKQNKFAFETEQKIHNLGIETLSFKLNSSDYEHKEIESGEVGTTFKNKAHELSLQFKHIPINIGNGSYKITGIIGTQYQFNKFSALGKEAFIPTTTNRHAALYAIEKIPLIPNLNLDNHQTSYLEFGIRAENHNIKADIENNSKFTINNPDKKINTYSTSASIFNPITSNLNSTLSLNYAQRAPTFYELFANGIHAATNAYELGDENLKKEQSIGLDLGLKYKKEGYEIKSNLFANKFKNYISLQNTSLKVDENGNQDINGINQYKYLAIPALFYGFELEGKIPLNNLFNKNISNMKQKLSLLWQMDYTRAYNTDNHEALPRISPLRLGFGLAYQHNDWHTQLKAVYNTKQNKIPDNEIKASGYTDLTLHVERNFFTKYGNLALFLKGDNLLNKDIRPASDFLRNTTPYGKRSVKIGMNLEF